ncbi:hypothetical protein CSC43_7240 [Pseudomonas aeruginosa]|nr:hypothetical protein CSC43_7240 [Pseudomonas aeruginosa]
MDHRGTASTRSEHKPFEQYLGTVAEFDSIPEASQRDLGREIR